MSRTSHSASALCSVPADVAFDFMTDGVALGGWALGSVDTEIVDDRGTVRGSDLITGEARFVRPVPYRSLELIVYELAVGASVEVGDMTPRVWAIVQPGERFGHASDSSLVTLIAWRAVAMSDDDWHELCVGHATEILLIKGQVERYSRG